MTFSLDSLIIAVLFLLPGFIATSIQLSRTPVKPAKQSAFQETLTSLSTSVVIFFAQLAILAILISLSGDIREEFAHVSVVGVGPYFSAHPTRSVLAVLIWGIGVLALSIAAGFLDPVERIALLNQRKLGVLSHDLWYDFFEEAPQRHGFTRSYVRTWHKNGICYAGWLETFELTNVEEKTRFFWLINAQRWATRADAEEGEPGEPVQGVLLNSDDIESIDVWWGDGPTI